jgi:hypothetical protein
MLVEGRDVERFRFAFRDWSQAPPFAATQVATWRSAEATRSAVGVPTCGKWGEQLATATFAEESGTIANRRLR